MNIIFNMFKNMLSFAITFIFHANISFLRPIFKKRIICIVETANALKLIVFSAMNIWFRMIKINVQLYRVLCLLK